VSQEGKWELEFESSGINQNQEAKVRGESKISRRFNPIRKPPGSIDILQTWTDVALADMDAGS
jgi:hypothetical protein